jgi:hypothetical protein
MLRSTSYPLRIVFGDANCDMPLPALGNPHCRTSVRRIGVSRLSASSALLRDDGIAPAVDCSIVLISAWLSLSRGLGRSLTQSTRVRFQISIDELLSNDLMNGINRWPVV